MSHSSNNDNNNNNNNDDGKNDCKRSTYHPERKHTTNQINDHVQQHQRQPHQHHHHQQQRPQERRHSQPMAQTRPRNKRTRNKTHRVGSQPSPPSSFTDATAAVAPPPQSSHVSNTAAASEAAPATITNNAKTPRRPQHRKGKQQQQQQQQHQHQPQQKQLRQKKRRNKHPTGNTSPPAAAAPSSASASASAAAPAPATKAAAQHAREREDTATNSLQNTRSPNGERRRRRRDRNRKAKDQSNRQHSSHTHHPIPANQPSNCLVNTVESVQQTGEPTRQTHPAVPSTQTQGVHAAAASSSVTTPMPSLTKPSPSHAAATGPAKAVPLPRRSDRYSKMAQTQRSPSMEQSQLRGSPLSGSRGETGSRFFPGQGTAALLVRTNGKNPSLPPPGLQQGDAYDRSSGTANSKLQQHVHAETMTRQPSSHSSILIGQLLANSLECAICTSGIGRRGKVWSCSRCYCVLHHSCVKKWYETKKNAEEAKHEGDHPSMRHISWSCPGCLTTFNEPPGPYTCWCKRTTSPPANSYLTPHACGSICGRSRGYGCTHPCNLLCHPGRCPRCPSFAAPRNCGCGRTEYRPRCGQDYAIDVSCYRTNNHVTLMNIGGDSLEKPPMRLAAKSCGAVCTRMLKCGRHKCTKTCHDEAEPCGAWPCSQMEKKFCDCGKELRDVTCYTVYCGARVSCGRACGRPLDCGIHSCPRPCHTGPCQTVKTAYPIGSAAAVINSYASLVTHMSEGAACGQICGSLRVCGHRCSFMCHAGSQCEAFKCSQMLQVTCSCGLKTGRVKCSDSNFSIKGGQQLECDEVCLRAEQSTRFVSAFGLEHHPSDMHSTSNLFSGKIWIPYPSPFLKKIIAHGLSGHVKRIEAVLVAAFAKDRLKRTCNTRSLSRHARWVCHQMAVYYGFSSEAFDKEPNRSVRFVRDRGIPFSPPHVLLSDALLEYRRVGGSGRMSDQEVERSVWIRSPIVHEPLSPVFVRDLVRRFVGRCYHFFAVSSEDDDYVVLLACADKKVRVALQESLVSRPDFGSAFEVCDSHGNLLRLSPSSSTCGRVFGGSRRDSAGGFGGGAAALPSYSVSALARSASREWRCGPDNRKIVDSRVSSRMLHSRDKRHTSTVTSTETYCPPHMRHPRAESSNAKSDFTNSSAASGLNRGDAWDDEDDVHEAIHTNSPKARQHRTSEVEEADSHSTASATVNMWDILAGEDN